MKKKMFSTILTCFCLIRSWWGVICLCTVCLVCGMSVHLACGTSVWLVCGTSVCLVCGTSVCLACGIRVCPMHGICMLRPGSKLWKHRHVAALLFHHRVILFSRIFKVFPRIKFINVGFVPFRNKVNTEYSCKPLLPFTLPQVHIVHFWGRGQMKKQKAKKKLTEEDGCCNNSTSVKNLLRVM